MGDVDDRGSSIAEVSDDLEQLLRLVCGECRGGLVHDDQLRLARKRTQDLNLLLICDPERTHGHPRRDTELRLFFEFVVAASQGAAIDVAGAGGLDPEEDVLDDAARRNEADLLGDHRHAVQQRISRRAKLNELAVDQQFAAVRLEHARDQLPERRLSCAILADKGVNPAPHDRDGDLVQRLDATEALAEVSRLDVGDVFHPSWRLRSPSTASGICRCLPSSHMG